MLIRIYREGNPTIHYTIEHYEEPKNQKNKASGRKTTHKLKTVKGKIFATGETSIRTIRWKPLTDWSNEELPDLT